MAFLRMRTFLARNVSVCLQSLVFLGMFLGLGQATLILAQNIPAQAGAQGGVQGGFPQAQQNQSQNQQASIRPNYILGANDQILVRAPEVDELNQRPFRIDPDGFVTLPLIGRVRAGGPGRSKPWKWISRSGCVNSSGSRRSRLPWFSFTVNRSSWWASSACREFIR